MRRKLAAPALAGALLAGAAGLAAAQSYGAYGTGCTAYGYYGGWGIAPPSSAPYPACNSIPSFGMSNECTGYPCPSRAIGWEFPAASAGWGYYYGPRGY